MLHQRKIFKVENAGESVKLLNLVKAQDQTAKKLRSELALRDAKIKDLQIQLEAARRRLAICDAPHPDQRTEVKSLRHALDSAASRVDDMERSLSWRLTMPLRGLGKTFGKP